MYEHKFRARMSGNASKLRVYCEFGVLSRICPNNVANSCGCVCFYLRLVLLVLVLLQLLLLLLLLLLYYYYY